MNRKVLMGVIIIAIVLLVILGAVLVWQINNISTEENVNDVSTNEVEEEYVPSNVSDYNLFYTMQMCLQKYETILNLNYEEQRDEIGQPTIAAVYGIETLEEKSTAILDLLDEDYINQNNINTANVISTLQGETQEVNVTVLEMRQLTGDERVNVYSVYANIESKENNETTNEYFIVKMDTTNETFSIYPLNNQEYVNIDEIQYNNATTQIEINDFNVYVYMEYNASQIAERYFQAYKQLMLTDSEAAFNKLDEEYRNERFGDLESFTEYINEHRTEIANTQISKYQAIQYDGYTQYICLKIDGYYWIINETSPQNYTLMLDTYSIDVPSFIERYNSASEINKVQLNFNKVFEAINMGDYEYVYDKLDSTFKQNNFPTLNDFEEYINNNLYTKINVEYGKYETSGNLYILELNLKNAENEEQQVTKTFIMQLKEGTDFVMSFTV